MRLFAIADLHLPGGDKKPMDIFGPHWERHFERISEDWREKVSPEDAVLIPGDISWAMQLSEALKDLYNIAELPGKILILRGNHDYWWSSLTQLRSSLPEKMHAIQNDAYDLGDFVVCGTRGWTLCEGGTPAAQDLKIYNRELLRLEMSLKEAKRIADGRPVVAMLHYPPLYPEQAQCGTKVTKLLADYGVVCCVYGHLHGASIRHRFCGMHGGVRYELVSCDSLDFKLKELTPL